MMKLINGNQSLIEGHDAEAIHLKAKRG